MQAPIIVRVNLSTRIPPEHDVRAEPPTSEGPPVEVCRLAYRIPHVSKAELQFGLEFDWLLESHDSNALGKHQPAICHNNLPRNKGCIIGQKEGNQPDNILRR